MKHANRFVTEWDGDLLVHPEDIIKILNTEGEFICYSEITSDEAVFVNTNSRGEVISFSTENGDYEWTGPACIEKNKIPFTKGNVFEQISPHLPIKGLKIRAFDIETYEDYKRIEELVKIW